MAYSDNKAYFFNDETFSSYDFNTDVKESLPVLSVNDSFSSAVIASENNIIYVLFPSQTSNNFYSFNEVTKEWIQLSDFAGPTRVDASIV